MRLVVCLVVVGAAVAVRADRDITVPLGRKLLDGTVRLEYTGVPGERDARAWLGTGFLKAYELEFSLERTKTQDWSASFDLSYNYTPPIVDVAPGLSVGVQDVLNRSENGRAAYLAMTYRYGNEGALNQDVPTELTFGLWSRSSGLAFVNVSLPFSDRVFLLGEHDSRRAAAGIRIRPLPGLDLKTVFEADGTHFGLSLRQKF
ncbi:MAG: hypothetical protein JST30_04225 [Armatimonadetes bacterium]|nr:hypothetical protein [Armatimonadota bacterium]